MKRLTILFLLLIFLTKAYSQITKGNWLVGGSGTVSRQQEKLIGSEVKSTNIQLSPDLGYFIFDKFSVGLRPNFGYIDLKTSTYHSQTTSWAVGPFARYYFLPDENKTNLFTETAYQYLSSSDGGSQNLFLFSGGPVIFFNNSVALELTANYKIFRIHNTETSSKTFFIAIGLQVHLVKDKD